MPSVGARERPRTIGPADDVATELVPGVRPERTSHRGTRAQRQLGLGRSEGAAWLVHQNHARVHDVARNVRVASAGEVTELVHDARAELVRRSGGDHRLARIAHESSSRVDAGLDVAPDGPTVHCERRRWRDRHPLAA